VVYLTDPTPVYPWSVVWPKGRQHPLLPSLLDAFAEGFTWPRDVWLAEADRTGLSA
jgi:hypothetical protein